MKSKDIGRLKEAKHAALQQQAAKGCDTETRRLIQSLCSGCR